jgi:chromosomal replication initiation ATPase DnaA
VKFPIAGRFFDDRGHTTVLHSLRRMENRAAKDPELHAYMTSVRQMFPSHRPPTGH